MINENFDIEQIKNKLKNTLNKKRYEHSLRVMECSKMLAEKYDFDIYKAMAGGLLHDCAKGLEDYYMSKYGIYFNKIKFHDYIDNKAILHAPLGSVVAHYEFNIQDKDILNSICYHTTGREDMSILEKIVFIADVIEPERNFDGIDILRKKALISLDDALLATLDLSIKHLINNKKTIHINSIKCKNYLILKEANLD